MKIYTKACGLAILLLFASTALWAGDIAGGATLAITSLYTYVKDTPAKASEVNQNFALVREAVNDNDSRITSLESGAFILNQNETVTGRPYFYGGTSGSTPPFYVDSTYRVSNLNADYLDGYHASSFLQTSQKPVIKTSVTSSQTISSSSLVQLASVSITTPGAGYVLVRGGCFLNISHSNSYDGHFLVGVGTSSTAYTEYTMTGVPKNAGSGMHLMSVSVSYPFYVSSAGTYTYYMTGMKNLSTGESGLAVKNRIIATFIPY